MRFTPRCVDQVRWCQFDGGGARLPESVLPITTTFFLDRMDRSGSNVLFALLYWRFDDRPKLSVTVPKLQNV